MATTAMKQSEFVALMEGHEKRLEELRAQGEQSRMEFPLLRISNADLRNVRFEGWDFSGVLFEDCEIGDVILTKSTELVTKFSNCTILLIEATNVEWIHSLELFNSTVSQGIYADKVEFFMVLLRRACVDKLRLTNCDRLWVRADYSQIWCTQVIDCKGRGLKYQRVETGFVDIRGNKFRRIDLSQCPNIVGHLTTSEWDVHFNHDMMRIGCQEHRIERWREMTDGEIRAMDSGALEWWGEWKEIIFRVVDRTSHHYIPTAGQLLDQEED